MWSFGWVFGMVTDLSTTWAEVIFRVKWIVLVSRCCYKSGQLKAIGQLSHDGVGWRLKYQVRRTHFFKDCRNYVYAYQGISKRRLHNKVFLRRKVNNAPRVNSPRNNACLRIPSLFPRVINNLAWTCDSISSEPETVIWSRDTEQLSIDHAMSVWYQRCTNAYMLRTMG